MDIALDCLPCFLKQTISLTKRLQLSPENAKVTLRRVLGELEQFESHAVTTTMARRLNLIIREQSGLPDPYAEEKQRVNAWMMQIVQDLKAKDDGWRDFHRAARLAVAGNVIDLGAFPDLNRERILQTLQDVSGAVFVRDDSALLQEKVQQAKRILYIGDNAGEIVFDKLFISLFPEGKTTFAVRGGPVLNDATRKDAAQVQMEDVATIIDTGAELPGVVLEESSQEFQTAFNEADLIISKGQGNYESLHDVSNRPIVYMLMAKCARVAGEFDCPIASYLITATRAEG